MKKSKSIFLEIRQLEQKQELEKQKQHERNRIQNRD